MFFPVNFTLFIYWTRKPTSLFVLSENGHSCLQPREKSLNLLRKQGENRSYPLTTKHEINQTEHRSASREGLQHQQEHFVHLTSKFFCFAQWRCEGGRRRRRRRSSVWGASLHRVTQNLFLCKIVLSVCVASIYLVCLDQPGEIGWGESISCQHCRRMARWMSSHQVHSTGGSRGPLGWMQRLPNPSIREKMPLDGVCFTVTRYLGLKLPKTSEMLLFILMFSILNIL